MPQHQQLNILRGLAPAAKNKQAEYRPHGRIQGREDHPPIMPNAGQRLRPKLLSPTGSAALTSAERMQLVDSSGHVLAIPSTPSASKTAFNDCTYATSCAKPSG
jgi:hypothetical protein